MAADDLKARPLNGYGAGSFGPTYLREGNSGETPAQAHGQLQELAATLGLPGLLLGCAVGAIGLAGLLRRRRGTSPALAGAAVGTACVLAHAQVDWHWQVPAVALPVVALLACGAALHPIGRAIPRRTARIGGGLVLALALLWVLPGFAAERLIERAIDNQRPGGGPVRREDLAARPCAAAARGAARAAVARPAGRARGRPAAARRNGAPGCSSPSSPGMTRRWRPAPAPGPAPRTRACSTAAETSLPAWRALPARATPSGDQAAA